MKIINLMENTQGGSGCLAEHGLSFYIETKKHKLLSDAGATDSFMENATRLGVDLKQADMMILSHGHYDHAGGIAGFAKINPTARILMQKSADGAYYHKDETVERYIGIDLQIMDLPQVELITGDKRIDDEIFLFSGVSGRRLWPSGNRELKVKRDGSFYQDEFLHEQYLVIEDKDGEILVSGCAHNGILNILDRFREIYKKDPKAVISGFHMRKKSEYGEDDLEVIRKIGGELKKMHTKFYTGHCTGEVPFQILKECMGDRLTYVHSGDEIFL